MNFYLELKEKNIFTRNINNSVDKVCEKQKRWIIQMDAIDELFDKADVLFEKAEILAATDLAGAVRLFQEGIGELYKAFILFSEGEPKGNFGELYHQCLGLNSEFDVIETEQGYFVTDDLSQLDPETVVDAANEIWDFVSGLLEEEEDF